MRDLGQWPQALNAFLEACRLEPENSEYLTGLGIIYNQLQKPDSAIHAFDAAYETNRDPGILYNRSMALLLAGQYQEGWEDYEHRVKVHKNKKILYEWHPAAKLWQGQPFPDQTLVVYNEQGLGRRYPVLPLPAVFESLGRQRDLHHPAVPHPGHVDTLRRGSGLRVQAVHA